jgi:hypothetical protein
MEAKEIGGALAGGLIAAALLETLLTKEILSIGDVRGVIRNARTALGNNSLMNAQDKAAADALDWLLMARFPEPPHK